MRVSLTVPFDDKGQEVTVGAGDPGGHRGGALPLGAAGLDEGLNIISCPSCSRVENEAFIELAQDVKSMTEYAQAYDITIAVMGCRVNGPGETDDADLGLWCGPAAVNLKKGPETLGHYGYDAILPRLKQEVDALIAEQASASPAG